MQIKNVSGILMGIGLVMIILQFMQPVMAAAPNLPNNSCADCHRKLLFSSEAQRQFIDIRIKHLENGITCSIVCHEDKLNKSTASTYALWSISTHALFEVTCDKCHGGNMSATSKDDAHIGLSGFNISRANTPEMCGKCHESELMEFKNSQHFKNLESGEVPAPACITCHQAHSVRVLTSSEIEDFCSNCHNNITGINPLVPKKAEIALSSVKELDIEIAQARSNIISEQTKGKDVSSAQANLESARTILKNVPSVWHRFNLTYFDTEVQKGIVDAKNAQNIKTEATATVTPKSPGFVGLLFISGLIAAYLLRRSA
ncbi:MAG: cytochrome c3 family protein [Candidatus Methanoperedens sp.]|nr:cytochrome c3 family protein [Candidatus Methanoperedens sp.]MCE8427642.1 cytochrome c3 family protein [Candidatus Methanoperedens sp.]